MIQSKDMMVLVELMPDNS